MRRPFQGLWNVIRFNWPFYVLALGLMPVVLVIRYFMPLQFRVAADFLLIFAAILTLLSLAVSWYVYDLAGFYRLDWLAKLQSGSSATIININAGFDETSELLKSRFPDAEMIVYDFYDPAKHTEASIKRARAAYPPFPGTRQVTTGELPLGADSADRIFAIFSAHEIRKADERRAFFFELNRILSPNGQVVVVEHLRDASNYLAYNIGALHFHSRESWLDTFAAARLDIEDEIKLTPFVTAFFLKKHGTAS
ncbi:MAG: class I SAM-dependent methyltransferase [Acidobacteriota bacterium]